MKCTSGLVDGVLFAHNDQALELRRCMFKVSYHHGLDVNTHLP